MPLPRSYLFVPANRPERFEKAFTSGAHAIIIDLEDSVPIAEKSTAREAARKWLSGGKPTLLRVNGSTTEWFADDTLLFELPATVGIVVPKAESAEELGSISGRTSSTRRILPIVETAQGFANIASLARTPYVDRLIFGSIDLQLDLGIHGDGRELDFFRSQLVLMSRLAGLNAPVDGVCIAISDTERLRTETETAKRFGFGGKLCIHPKQVAVVNECFMPTMATIAWARKVVASVSLAGGSAVQLDDGTMVDRPVLLRAEAILRELEHE